MGSLVFELWPVQRYELTKAFHSSVQFFWPAQTSQIYLTLGKLEDAGLVTHETVIQNETE